MIRSLSAKFLLFLLIPLVISPQNRKFVNAQLAWHETVLDPQGKLLAWYKPEKNLGYDKVLRLGWDFIEHKVPRDTRGKTGQKIYLVNSVFDPETLQGINWQHNPAMVYATSSRSSNTFAWIANSSLMLRPRFFESGQIMCDLERSTHIVTAGTWNTLDFRKRKA
jgi:hypothetical protein